MNIKYNNLDRNAPLLITGATGGLGQAVFAYLQREGFTNLLVPTRSEMDLLNRDSVIDYLALHRPQVIIHLASVVFGLGGNLNNQMRAAYENAIMHAHFFSELQKYPPKRLFFAGTVASYPFPYQTLPLVEDYFFAGLPHAGEFGYAMAKRHAYTYLHILSEETGLHYTYGILTNLYGPNDRFNVEKGHVIPSLIAKAYVAAESGGALEVWGDGQAQRDFLHFDDAARAIVFCLEQNENQLINISSGQGTHISYVAQIIATAAGVSELRFVVNKPVGISNRVVDNSQITRLGFMPSVPLKVGLEHTYYWYAANVKGIRQ